MKKYVVIVAAGKGSRMTGTLPKQFLQLDDKPVLMHTISRFSAGDYHKVVVIAPDYIHYWKSLCDQLGFILPHEIKEGGDTRSASVWNGIHDLPDNSLVAIHDAARPLPGFQLIERLFTAAADTGSAVPVVPVTDSLRLITEDGNQAVPREKYMIVQTPQVFNTGLLKSAFAKNHAVSFTDEASLWENAGMKVTLIAGEETNIKLTIPADITVAEAYIKHQI